MHIRAYPNFDANIDVKHSDLNKWIAALKDIYIKKNLGLSDVQATDAVIKNWDRVEQRDFKDWKRYYTSGDIFKYKMAQNSYYVNDNNGYFLPNPSNVPSPIKSITDTINNIPQQSQNIVQHNPEQLPVEDKRKIIEDHRRRLIGRLNAAEKLLTSPNGQMFAGADFDKLLDAIYNLKRQIQTINKISLSMQTCVDLIIKQANILKRSGSDFGAEFMIKLAQGTPGNFSAQLGDIPAGGSAPQGQGSLLNNTPPIPGLTTPADDKEDKSSGIDGFFENMKGSGIAHIDDKNDIEDDILFDDDDIVLDDDLLDQEIAPEDLVVEAQMLPTSDVPKKQMPKDLEVSEDPITPDLTMPQEQVGQKSKDVDDVIEGALANISVNDVVSKMEDVANIFRNREISRQISIIDLMMQKLNIQMYFNELGECAQKNLDCAQYSLTRLDSMLSRLKGAQPSGNLDLEGKENSTPPQAQGLANSLEKAEKEEKNRKQMKKDLENQKLQEQTKPVPEVEGIEEGLGAAPVQQSEQLPVKLPIQPKPPSPGV